MLGVQYLYKSGYDPTAFVDFLERMQALERGKPGTLSQVFKSHPKLASRITHVQRHIQGFASQPQYAITTSEFQDVQWELRHNRPHRRPERPGPTLRRSPKPESDDRDTPDSDERPTLKRRGAISVPAYCQCPPELKEAFIAGRARTLS